jgi:hypothetical protein
MRKYWVLLALNAVLSLTMAAAHADDEEEGFNQPENILITDQFNNRVIEINPAGKIVWHFGIGPNDFSPKSIIGTNDAERVGNLTLMAGTGTPAGTAQAPACTSSSGCADNRVILVDRDGEIVWQYGTFGVTGSGPNQLNVPVQNTFLATGNVLITDQSNQRVIEVRISDKAIVWQYGVTGLSGGVPGIFGAPPTDPNCSACLNNPNAAELLANGHILISDENNNRAIEVTHTTTCASLPCSGSIVRTFTAGGTVSGMAFASRLPNDHTLLTDANNSRIVEVDRHDNPVWQYFTNDPAGNAAPLPTRAVRLANGHTLISDQFNDRVIEVNRAKQIVASYGTLNVFGFNAQNASVMNAPYSAYKIGDYTGLTPPF